MQVPLLDLKAQYATIKDEVLAAVSEVLETQICIGGPKVAELEGKVAAISDCKFAVGASSGTDAILNSLMKSGDWQRRRGYYYAVHVFFDCRLHRPHRCKAGIRRYRPADFQYQCRACRLGGYGKNQGDYAHPFIRANGRYGPYYGNCQET